MVYDHSSKVLVRVLSTVYEKMEFSVFRIFIVFSRKARLQLDDFLAIRALHFKIIFLSDDVVITPLQSLKMYLLFCIIFQ